MNHFLNSPAISAIDISIPQLIPEPYMKFMKHFSNPANIWEIFRAKNTEQTQTKNRDFTEKNCH